MWQSLHDAWWRLATQDQPTSCSDALACRVLQTCSGLYRAAVGLGNTAYDRGWRRSVRLPCRVVSVGNLTVGGTGKTTCVELLVRKLTGLGRRVAVLSRGYGGARRTYWVSSEHGRVLVDGALAAGADGLADEPQVLAQHLEGTPVIVGVKREVSGAFACRRFGAEVVVLDDGFQHRRLHRDCDMVLVHSRMPLSGLRLLPRGPMREPLASLRRAHVIIMTKAEAAPERLGCLRECLHALNPSADLVTASHQPVTLMDGRTEEIGALSRLAGAQVALVSSIGDPEGFESTIRSLQAEVAWHRSFPDHHRYGRADWEALRTRVAATRAEALVTTEKDWVRLQPVLQAGSASPVPVWIIGVRMHILSGEHELDDRLARVCVR